MTSLAATLCVTGPFSSYGDKSKYCAKLNKFVGGRGVRNSKRAGVSDLIPRLHSADKCTHFIRK